MANNKSFSVFGGKAVDFDATSTSERELFGVNVRVALKRNDSAENYLYLPISNDLAFMKPMELKLSNNTNQQFIQSVQHEQVVYGKLVDLCEKVKATGVKTVVDFNEILLKPIAGLDKLVLVLTPQGANNITSENVNMSDLTALY